MEATAVNRAQSSGIPPAALDIDAQALPAPVTGAPSADVDTIEAPSRAAVAASQANPQPPATPAIAVPQGRVGVGAASSPAVAPAAAPAAVEKVADKEPQKPPEPDTNDSPSSKGSLLKTLGFVLGGALLLMLPVLLFGGGWLLLLVVGIGGAGLGYYSSKIFDKVFAKQKSPAVEATPAKDKDAASPP